MKLPDCTEGYFTTSELISPSLRIDFERVRKRCRSRFFDSTFLVWSDFDLAFSIWNQSRSTCSTTDRGIPSYESLYRATTIPLPLICTLTGSLHRLSQSSLIRRGSRHRESPLRLLQSPEQLSFLPFVRFQQRFRFTSSSYSRRS